MTLPSSANPSPSPQERGASRFIVFATAMSCGVLLGISIELISVRLGIGVSGSWHDMMTTNAHALRATLGWWAVGGAGLLGSLYAGRLMRSPQHDVRSRRRWQWLIGALFVLLLAAVPYFATARADADPSFGLAAELAAFGLATVMACCGGWLALPD